MNRNVEAAPLLRPLITTKGLQAAVEASTLGKAVKIVKVGITEVPGTAAAGDTSLPGAQLVDVADGRLVNDHQVNVSALLPDTFPSMGIAGIAFYLEDGTMFAVYRETEAFLEHTGGTTLLVGMDLVMDNIPSDSVIVESTGANLILGDWVPVERRVNGKALTADIMLNANDVNAAPSGFGLGTSAPALGSASCDTVMKTGWSGISSSTPGTPDGQGPTGSVLHTMASGNSVVHQVFHNYANGKTYKRTYKGNAWGAWKAEYSESNPPPVADLSGYVPKTRKVNNKALDADITLAATDVGAAPASHSHSNYVPTTRKVNGYELKADVTLSAADVGVTNVGLGGGVVGVGDVGITDLNKITTSGHYYTSSASDLNRPSAAAGPIVHVQGAAGYQQYIRDNDFKFRGFTGTDFKPWQTVYHTGNKPDAADVGALPITGGTLTGALTVGGGVTANNGRFLCNSSSVVPMYEMHIPGKVANAMYTIDNGDLIFCKSNGSGANAATYATLNRSGLGLMGNVTSSTVNRSWGSIGTSGLYVVPTVNAGQGSLEGCVSMRSFFPGVYESEAMFGTYHGSSWNDTAMVLSNYNNTAKVNATWWFRNSGILVAPNNAWTLSGNGDITGGIWGSSSSLSNWIKGYAQKKVSAHSEIGSYMLATVRPQSNISTVNPGTQVAGSNMNPAGVAEYSENRGMTLTGTWMAMGAFKATNIDDVWDDRTTLFIRIA